MSSPVAQSVGPPALPVGGPTAASGAAPEVSTPAAPREQATARVRRRLLTWGLPLLFWTLFALFAGTHTYVVMLSHGHSYWRIIFYQLLVCLFWAAATPLIALLARLAPLVPLRFWKVVVHFVAAGWLTTLYVAWMIAMQLVVRPFDVRGISHFFEGFPELLSAHFPLEVLTYWGILGAIHAFAFYRRSQERDLRAAELERELARARLDALASQLQPHFLFNALHTVSALVRAGESRSAITTIAGLSDLLRYALDSRAAPEVPLGEELEVVRRYLAIQQLRFGDRLAVRIEVAPEAIQACVPRLLLQPLVENAVRHGVAASDGSPWIELDAVRRGDELTISLRNSTPVGGAPRPLGEEEQREGRGIGLGTTRERLRQLYGDAQRLEVRRPPGRFELSLVIPWREASTLAAAPSSRATR